MYDNYNSGYDDSGNYRVQRFSILPPVVRHLLILNVIFWLADMVLAGMGIDLSRYLGLHYFTAKDFHIWQFVTYMFMHGGFSHLFFNMFALWMFGYALENYWGSKRFLVYYLVTGIGAGIVQDLVFMFDIWRVAAGAGQSVGLLHMFSSDYMAPIMPYVNRFITVGASGAVFGILLAFGMCFPNAPIYLYFFIPIRAKWFVVIYGLIELFAGLGGSADGVAHFAHVGGMLFGFFLIRYWRRHGSRIRDEF